MIGGFDCLSEMVLSGELTHFRGHHVRTWFDAQTNMHYVSLQCRYCEMLLNTSFDRYRFEMLHRPEDMDAFLRHEVFQLLSDEMKRHELTECKAKVMKFVPLAKPRPSPKPKEEEKPHPRKIRIGVHDRRRIDIHDTPFDLEERREQGGKVLR